MTTTPTPAAGQIWQDSDRRSPDRYLRVVEITETHARVEPVAWGSGGWVRLPGMRRTRIRLDRLRPGSTGYRYVEGGAQ